ncbi:MAG: ribonuclease III [Rudaea sp.]
MSAELAYRFNDPQLRERALTHRSVGARNNERLEFLGDGLVNLFVAELLYEIYPRADEGELTRFRSRLVSEPSLAAVARELQLGDQLLLGPGELKSGGHRRDSILADAFEALVAAVYLDGGWDVCRHSVRTIFEPRTATLGSASERDPKTHLQELLQGDGKSLPTYELIASSGADHAKVFDVACVIESIDVRGQGSGNSRRAAEQAAAKDAIEKLSARPRE